MLNKKGNEMSKYNDIFGSPYNRGSADAHYSMPFKPHYFKGLNKGGTFFNVEVPEEEMTREEIEAYTAGYRSE